MLVLILGVLLLLVLRPLFLGISAILLCLVKFLGGDIEGVIREWGAVGVVVEVGGGTSVDDAVIKGDMTDGDVVGSAVVIGVVVVGGIRAGGGVSTGGGNKVGGGEFGKNMLFIFPIFVGNVRFLIIGDSWFVVIDVAAAGVIVG